MLINKCESSASFVEAIQVLACPKQSNWLGRAITPLNLSQFLESNRVYWHDSELFLDGYSVSKPEATKSITVLNCAIIALANRIFREFALDGLQYICNPQYLLDICPIKALPKDLLLKIMSMIPNEILMGEVFQKIKEVCKSWEKIVPEAKIDWVNYHKTAFKSCFKILDRDQALKYALKWSYKLNCLDLLSFEYVDTRIWDVLDRCVNLKTIRLSKTINSDYLLPKICKIFPELNELHLELPKDLTRIDQLPEKLNTLYLKIDPCAITASFPASLRQLYICCGTIDKLPTLPCLLESLVLFGAIKALPTLPENLKKLRYNQYYGAFFPSLSQKLEEIEINNCESLASLPELPTTLRRLDLNKCPLLTGLPLLPQSLTVLRITECVSQIFALPCNLQELSLLSSPIESLPEIPTTLKTLTLRNSDIANLPVLPMGLENLDISKCYDLKSQFSLPPSLRMFVITRAIQYNFDGSNLINCAVFFD